MKSLLTLRKALWLTILLLCSYFAEAQFLMDMIDTTTDMGKGMLNMYSRFDRLRFSGYIQPQFQLAQEKGQKSFEGGDFAPNANSRFMMRRSRVRIDYVRSNKDHKPSMQFVFQFDASERGVAVRDVWARLFDNKYERFSFTAGVFARPFGYEVNLSSSDRESPERGRMSQILMKTERDLGAMVSFDSRKKGDKLRYLKIDAGFFNGQGLNGPGEFDGFKDFIGRVSLKPFPLTKKLSLSAGLSYLHGGLIQNSKYRYEMKEANGTKFFQVDSAAGIVNQKNPRNYHGVDAQLKWKHKWGATEFRAEYWWGTQTASAATTETPGVLLNSTDGYYIRNFNGAFFYFLQNIGNSHHQLGLKYDWYDPNTKVSGNEIGKAGANVNATNIKYNTLSLGYNYYVNENLKLFFWYDFIKNENTQQAGFTKDLKDNVFTCRLQYRF